MNTTVDYQEIERLKAEITRLERENRELKTEKNKRHSGINHSNQRPQKSEERYRAIFEHALEAIIIWDDGRNIIKANHAASRMFELPLYKLEKKNLKDFININDPKVASVYDTFWKVGEIRAELIFEMPNSDRKKLEFTSKKGIIDGYNLTIFRNVSERNRMEKELRESEQKFRKIFNSDMNGIILFNQKYEIVDINQAACNIIEISKENLIGVNFLQVIVPDSIQELEKISSKFKLGKEINLEMPIQFFNGKTKYIEFSCKHHVISGLNMLFFKDVTDKKEMEEQLRKSDTLNIVGELAAGIAHEIRNPMTALKGFIQLLQSNVKEDFSMYFGVIQSELKRIESIITEFLVLAKPQATIYKQNNIVQIMKETVELINAQAILHNVQIFTNFAMESLFVYCEPNQLKQVFINILKNAIEVMPDGGTIMVTIHQHGEESIMISIADQGFGIPQDKLNRLGEPFYTTKERGTGLGLMVSYKIIKEHHGKIHVESTVGKGTTFFLSLPKGLPMEE